MTSNVEIFDILKKIYPKDTSFLNKYYDESNEIKLNKFLLNSFLINNQNRWLGFKKELIDNNLNIIDYSCLPEINSCIKFEVVLGRCNDYNYYSTYYLSPFFSGYCFLTNKFNNSTKSITWNTKNNQVDNNNELIIANYIKQYFSDYQLVNFDILQTIVPSYSIDPFLLGKAKIFNLLFTYDPIYDKYIL